MSLRTDAEPKKKNASGERTVAERVSFGVVCSVLLVVVVLIVAEMAHSSKPAAPVAVQSAAIRATAGRFFVPVEVVNRGDVTAESVQVSAELTIDGETTTGDQIIDFLAGDEVEDLTFAFDDDPRDGELVIRVTGFATP